MKILLSILVLGALVVGIYTYVGYTARVHDLTTLATELAGFNVPTVTYQGAAYTVDGGTVLDEQGKTPKEVLPILRIAYASVISRLDPPYGIEGTNPDAFERSVQDLNDFQTALVGAYPSTQSMYVAQLFPVDFLRAVAKAERARQALITAPSDTHVKEYAELLHTIVKENRTYINAVVSFLSTQGSNTKGTLAFFDGKTTLEQYVSSVQDYEQTLDKTAQAIDARTRCFDQFTGECTSLQDAFVRLTAAASTTPAVAVTLPATVEANRALIASFINNTDTTSEAGAVVALAKSPCFAQFSPVYYLSSHAKDANSGKYSLSLINEVYFYDSAKHAADARFPQELKDKDPYAYQSVANLYLCLASGHDLVRARTLEELAQKTNTTVLPVVSESDTLATVAKLGASLAVQGEREFALTHSTSSAYEAERMLEITREQSSHLDEIVRDVIANEDAINLYASEDARLPLTTLFLARSFLPLLLLSYNASVVPQPLVLTTPYTYDISLFGLVAYSLLRGQYPPARMLQIMLQGTAIIKSAR